LSNAAQRLFVSERKKLDIMHVNISFLNLVAIAIKFNWRSLLKKILRGNNSMFTLDDYDWNKKIPNKTNAKCLANS